jgi:IclR family pca regulon transcriptional regulator
MRPVTDSRKASPKSNPKRFVFVQSLERGLAVIRSFNGARSEQTLTDVAKVTGLDRAAARRFLLTLEALGYVEQDGKLFRLRPETLQLGYSYLASLPWWRSAQRISEQLTERIKVSCAVGVLNQHDIVYVAYASAGRFPLLANRSVGTHLPAISSAIGRVLVAALPADQLKAWLSKATLEKYTPRTKTNRRDIEKVLEEVRSAGYSIVDQELEMGLRSIGVPIKDNGGTAVAGLSVSTVDSRMTPALMIKRYLQPLQEASKHITSTLPV